MRTVVLPLKAGELSTQMAAMRIWLDQHRFEPSSFVCRDSSAGILVRVDFKLVNEADAFARQFRGRIDRVTTEDELGVE
ncbi:MAG TPA: hypothetical protein VMF05_05900 [Stellaceae bacterium]|nr:hypothetical protein [Stellaceae bacterium]